MTAPSRPPFGPAYRYGTETGNCVLRSPTLFALLSLMPMPLFAVTDDRPTTLAGAAARQAEDRAAGLGLIGSSRHIGDPVKFRGEMLQRNQTSLALIHDRLRQGGLLGKPPWQSKAAKLLTWGYVGLIGIGVVRMFTGMAAGWPRDDRSGSWSSAL